MARLPRGAVLRNLDGLDDDQARWSPDGKLIPLLGIVSHLTRVEWRWIDGAFGGVAVSRSEDEFRPGPELGLDEARGRLSPPGRRHRGRSSARHR